MSYFRGPALDGTDGPITFAQAMQGHQISATNSWLFTKMPPGVLREITSYLKDDPQTLASLALVNSDCRQLARSCQFRTLRLDLSGQSNPLLSHLLHEAAERETHGYNSAPSIGVCVRQLKLAMVNFDPRRQHGLIVPLEEIEDVRERWDIILAQVALLLRHDKLPNLPNLRHFDSGIRAWEMQQHLLDRILSSRVRHLYLRSSLTDLGNYPRPLRIPSWAWWPPWKTALETLEVDMVRTRYDHAVHSWDITDFVVDLLYLGAPHLRSLRLTNVDAHPLFGCVDTFQRLPEMPNLEVLFVNKATQFGLAFMRSLFRGTSIRLRTLVFDVQNTAARLALVERGRINTLQTVIWHSQPIMAFADRRTQDLVGSLSYNPQITGFCCTGSIDPGVAKNYLLPTLIQGFKSLTKLSITFTGTEIPEASLALIGQIHSLKELHISVRRLSNANVGRPSAGASFLMSPPSTTWPIDHRKVLAHLGPGLPLLERLYIHPDDSRMGINWERAMAVGVPVSQARQPSRRSKLQRRYTIFTKSPNGRATTGGSRANPPIPPPWTWSSPKGMAYATKMRNIADSYVINFPRLQRLVLGRVHFRVVAHNTVNTVNPSDSSSSPAAATVTFPPRHAVFDGFATRRWEYIEEMFGLPMDTTEDAGDETALGLEEYPCRPNKAYPPLVYFTDDEGEEDENGGSSSSCRSRRSRRSCRSRSGSSSGSESESSRSSRSGSDAWSQTSIEEHVEYEEISEADIPRARFFCEACFLNDYRIQSRIIGRRHSDIRLPIVQEECAHRRPAPNAAWLALMGPPRPAATHPVIYPPNHNYAYFPPQTQIQTQAPVSPPPAPVPAAFTSLTTSAHAVDIDTDDDGDDDGGLYAFGGGGSGAGSSSLFPNHSRLGLMTNNVLQPRHQPLLFQSSSSQQQQQQEPGSPPTEEEMMGMPPPQQPPSQSRPPF